MSNTPEFKRRRGVGRVAFLARLEPIRTAVERGFPLTIVYGEQGAELGLSYSQFHRYVGRYVRTDDKLKRPAPSLDDEPAAPRQAPVQPLGIDQQPGQPCPAPAGGPGQRFRHSAEPDAKDDLI